MVLESEVKALRHAENGKNFEEAYCIGMSIDRTDTTIFSERTADAVAGLVMRDVSTKHEAKGSTYQALEGEGEEAVRMVRTKRSRLF